MRAISANTPRKTKQMLAVEGRFGERLERLIPRLYYPDGRTLKDAALLLGVSEATVCFWMIRLGIQAKRLQAPGSAATTSVELHSARPGAEAGT